MTIEQKGGDTERQITDMINEGGPVESQMPEFKPLTAYQRLAQKAMRPIQDSDISDNTTGSKRMVSDGMGG